MEMPTTSVHKRLKTNDGQRVMAKISQSKCLLDLPVEILVRVINEAGISNLGQMFDESFLKAYQTLKEALIEVVKKKPNLRFENNPVGRSWFEKEAADVITVGNSREFRNMHNFYVTGGIKAVNEIHYSFEEPHHFSDFQLLLENLKYSQEVKLKVSLEKRDEVCVYNLNRLFALFMKVKEMLLAVELKISIDTDFGMSGPIDLDCFSCVEELIIVGFNVRGSLQNCNNLKRLYYEPGEHNDMFLDLRLPSSLKSLKLHQCQWYKQSLRNLSSHRFSLEEICLQFDGKDEGFSKSMVTLLQNLTCVNTSQVFFKSSKFESTDLALNRYLDDVSQKATPLTLLTLELVSTPLTLSPSNELDLTVTLGIDSRFASSLATNLRVLKLTGCIGFENYPCWELVPACIEVLDLSDTLPSAVDTMKDFSKFTNLKELYMSGNEISYSHTDLKFPDSIEFLDLSRCSIESIHEVRFPKRLLVLDLLRNKLKSIHRPDFPKPMKKLDLSFNGIIMLDLRYNALEEALEIKLLKRLFNEVSVIDHVQWRLPSGVVEYHAEFCRPGNLNFDTCNSLEYLNLRGSDLRYASPLRLDSCSNLKYLCLSGSTYTLNNSPLPPLLEEANLQKMELKEVPSQLSFLPRLRVLNLSGNNITHVDVKLSSSVETIDMSDNLIESFLLLFWGNVESRLRNLLLSHNRLTEITAESLGFKSNVVYNEVYEFDFSYNEELVMNQELLTILSRSSLQHLWLKEGQTLVNKVQGGILERWW